jgi:hypothetical protein
MNKTAALIAALVVFFLLSAALVRTENQRYALFVGMCRDPVTLLTDSKCLKNVETRTAWWWHLYYALKG